jgi:hypothetical protein
MPLYLDEIYLTQASPEKIKTMLAGLRNAVEKGAFPQGVTLKAGPWFSNEDLRVILVLDIQDHSLTFGAFSGALLDGSIEKRRLTPIVDWETAKAVLK